MAQLELKNICKGCDHPVIDNLSLELEKGEFDLDALHITIDQVKTYESDLIKQKDNSSD